MKSEVLFHPLLSDYRACQGKISLSTEPKENFSEFCCITKRSTNITLKKREDAIKKNLSASVHSICN